MTRVVTATIVVASAVKLFFNGFSVELKGDSDEAVMPMISSLAKLRLMAFGAKTGSIVALKKKSEFVVATVEVLGAAPLGATTSPSDVSTAISPD